MRCGTTRRCSTPTWVSRSTRTREDSAMLAVEDVVTPYRAVPAPDRGSPSVDAATITAVLGANGAGKTTLLRTVNGLVRPRAGRVVFDGHDLTRTPVEKVVQLGVAHVPEGR